MVPNTAFAPRTLAATAAVLDSRNPGTPGAASSPEGFEIAFRNDPAVLDGRFANNGWLQELPKPITKITWDNAVMVSPATASRLNVTATPAMVGGEHGQIVCPIVELRYRAAPSAVRCSRWSAIRTIARRFISATGARARGRLANGAGFSAQAIRTADAPWFGRGVEIVATGDEFSVACTQYHHLMEGRHLVHATTRDEFVRDPKSVHEAPGLEPPPPRMLTLYPEYPYEGYKWGMAIDRERLHRLQRLRGRLPGGEQHSRGRQGGGPARPRDALDSHRHATISGPLDNPETLLPAGARACIARTRRASRSARSARRCTAPKA